MTFTAPNSYGGVFHSPPFVKHRVDEYFPAVLAGLVDGGKTLTYHCTFPCPDNDPESVFLRPVKQLYPATCMLQSPTSAGYVIAQGLARLTIWGC